MISVKNARYLKDHLISIEFSDGLSGVIDLTDTIGKYEAAAELRDPKKFADFHLDEWPTLAWKCGFDLSPEYLYELLTGSVPTWSQQPRTAMPVVAEEKARYES
jgi:hypothetical protein